MISPNRPQNRIQWSKALLLALFALFTQTPHCSKAASIAPAGLMCEMMADPSPVAITDDHPEFGWIVPLPDKGAVQKAYQVLVASDLSNIQAAQGDMWDSGMVKSAQSVGVEYAGKPLGPDTTYYWRVRTWNEDGQASPYSQVQTFRTGVLEGSYVTTRYPLVTTAVEPVRVVTRGDGDYFVDFGKAAFGTIELTVTSPARGHRIEIHLGEVPAAPFSIDASPGGTRRYKQLFLTLGQGTQTYKLAIPPDQRNTGRNAIKMPESAGEVMPFRYCEIIGSPSAIDASTIRQIAVHYPFDDGASRFNSSDPVLNDVWDLCKYSIKATSFCGVYVDGDRERIPYEADAYINQLCHYNVDREYTMARYSHEYLITHPTWPTEWILHSVLMAWADYLYTGDTDSIEHYYDDLKAKTLLSLAREDGLISTQTGLVTPEVLKSIHFSGTLRDIVDWPHGNILGLQGGYGETDDFEFKPINTVVNAFHYRALVVMSRMAQAVGETQDAAQFASAAAKVKASFNEKLLDKTKGIYVDGEGSTHSALHANMFPLAFGLVPEEYVESVGAFLKSRGMVCSVYGSQYLLEALYAAGLDDFALHLMTDRDSDRSWAHMVYDVGTTITLEAWDNKYKPNQDWNHAWGAAPGNIIPRCLMGVEPIEAGFAKVQIRPQVGPLTNGSLDLPTVRGTIHVDFNATEGQAFVLNLATPANVPAIVYVPTLGGNSPEVIMDGQSIQGQIEGNFIVLDNIAPGPHCIERRL